MGALRQPISRSVFVGNSGPSIHYRIAAKTYDILRRSSVAGLRHHDGRIFARSFRAKSCSAYDIGADRPISCGFCCKNLDHLGYVAHEQANRNRACRKRLVFGNYLVEPVYYFKAYRAVTFGCGYPVIRIPMCGTQARANNLVLSFLLSIVIKFAKHRLRAGRGQGTTGKSFRKIADSTAQ